MIDDILLMATSALWLFTLWVLADAIRRRGDLRKFGVNGDLKLFLEQSVRHESFRLAKHTLIVGMVGVAVFRPDWFGGYRAADVRTWGIAAIGVLIGVNSLMDIVSRRRRWRIFMKSRGIT